jgi:rhodanese-related sulfurtransferase
MTARKFIRTAAALALLSGCWTIAANREVPSGDLIAPSQVNDHLAEVRAEKIVLIHVGFRVMYEMGHIPGSKYTGSASTPEGLAGLRKFAAKLPRNQRIIIYCGCCPMEHCPNIRPACDALKEMGFSQVKVLNIPERFGDDWTAKGYPVEKGDSGI